MDMELRDCTLIRHRMLENVNPKSGYLGIIHARYLNPKSVYLGIIPARNKSVTSFINPFKAQVP